MISEFKDFAVKGNVMDMAVGIIIGGAFGTIVKSAVDDIIMPPIGMLLGNVDFSKLSIVLREAGEGTEEVAIRYGAFINSVIAFLIVAWVLFLIVKAMNEMRREEEAAPAEPPPPPRSEALLEEIRDLLKK